MIRRRLLAALAVAAALFYRARGRVDPRGDPGRRRAAPCDRRQVLLGDANGDAEALPCGYPLEGGDRLAQAVQRWAILVADGTPDVAVGTSRDGDGANHAGAVYVLNLNADGTVKHTQKISAAYGMADGVANPLSKEASMPWKRKMRFWVLCGSDRRCRWRRC